MISDCVVELCIHETAWVHYATSRLHDYVMQTQDCVNSKIAWNIYMVHACVYMCIAENPV